MGKLVAVGTLQSAAVKHCYGIVGDTLNLIARSLEKNQIEWVSMRHEEAGAFAARAEAQLADRLTAVAGSCGPGSLHFINGIFEANRNRAPVMLIASQIIRDELGFDFIQEVDFKQVYRDCSLFCGMIHTPEQARRKIVIACQTALAKRGVAVLTAVKDWLGQPGPALLHVHVDTMQLVMPPFMQVKPAIGMALYSARAILHGRGGDVWEMVEENFL